MSREFRFKSAKSLRVSGPEPRSGLELKNSLFFSLSAGNFRIETGSYVTASATTQSHVWRDFPVAGAFTNLSRCGKVVSTKVGCGRIDGKYSRVSSALM